MNATDRRKDVELLLDEAAYRLTGALKRAPAVGEDARIACENAHDAIEVSLNAVIVARGERYRASHDLSQLADVVAQAGEAIPAALSGIRDLRPYTGGGRYSYRTAGRVDPATSADYEQIVNLGRIAYAWAGGRARALCGARAPHQAVHAPLDDNSPNEPDSELKPLQPGGDAAGACRRGPR